MRKRKNSLLQRMFAMLLAAVLITGMVSNAAPVSVLAQEITASSTPDGQQESVGENRDETVEEDTEPKEETSSEEQKPEEKPEQETPKPEEGTEEETPKPADGAEEETPKPEEETEQEISEPEEETEQETPKTDTEEETGGTTVAEAGQDLQALLARIAALPDAEEYLATEPDVDSGKADADVYEEWLAGLYAHGEKALAIQEEIEKLPEEQRVQISEEELQKLAAWVEIVQTAGEIVQTAEPGAQMMAAEPAPQADLAVTRDALGDGCTLENGKLTITSDAGMTNWKTVRDTYQSDVTSVEIAGEVTSIVDFAFQECTSLKEITISGKVTSIGTSAFYQCTSLKEVTISASVESIGNGAFQECTRLEKIAIPASVESIGNSAFHKCTSLKEITIPASVTSIGESAFYRCSILKGVTIPASVTSIGGLGV